MNYIAITIRIIEITISCGIPPLGSDGAGRPKWLTQFISLLI